MAAEMIKGQKVLVVEDEQAIREALALKMEREGFVVFQARDGKEGLEIAERERPDLILLDLLMPRMDGVDMMKRMRQEVWGAHIKVIIFTNLDSDDRILNAIMVGEPAYYLLKANVDIGEVVEKAHEVLKQ